MLSKQRVIFLHIYPMFLLIFSLSTATLSYSQSENQTNYKIYENKNLGIKFDYPLYWEVRSENSDTSTCLLLNYCRITLGLNSNYSSLGFFEILSFRLNHTSFFNGIEIPVCDCNNSRDFAKWFLKTSNSTPGFENVINENETSIGKDHDAYLLETSSSSTNTLDIWTINDGIGYLIFTLTEDDFYKQNLNEIRQMIDSITFIKAEKITKRSILLGD